MVTHPFVVPTRLMYCLLVAQVMYSAAAALFLLAPSTAIAQDHSQCEPLGVVCTGAYVKPILPASSDCLGSSRKPAATVASSHMATLPVDMRVSHSVKPSPDAPGSP